ncbi:MAG: hypothetical protein IJC43_10900 [Clostridia bacterium]|nr:hypothetical protein [Clostridia bacterium]
MKKSLCYTGIVYILAGLGLVAVALTTESRLGSLLFGFGGALIGPGAAMVFKYFYWSRPDRAPVYAARLEEERRERRDELKERLRDRSGRISYLLGLMVVAVSMMVLSVLEVLGLLEGARWMVLFLAGYLVFQITAGVAVFNRLLRKYE